MDSYIVFVSLLIEVLHGMDWDNHMDADLIVNIK